VGLSGGGSWFGRATAGQEVSSASASCAAKELAIDRNSFTATLFELWHGRARRIEISQCRNNSPLELPDKVPLALTIRAIALS